MFDRMDKPSRNLVILGVVAVLFVVLAFYAVTTRFERTKPEFEPRPMFDNFVEKLEDASELELTDKNGTLVIRKGEGDVWGLPERGGFPALVEPLRRTFLGLAELELVKPKTQNPEWHEHLDLKAPQNGGDAIHVVVKDNEGAVLADVLIGRREDMADINGIGFLHVRRPGEDQTWLARGSLSINTNLNSWTYTEVLSIDQSRIKSAAVDPTELSSFTLERQSRSGRKYKLSPMPRGRAAAEDDLLHKTATAVAGLDIKDVRPLKDFDFSEGAEGIYKTYDGLTLTVRTIREGEDGDFWISIDAEAETGDDEDDPQAAAVKAEAERTNALAKNWAFKVDEETGEAFDRKLYELIVVARRGRNR